MAKSTKTQSTTVSRTTRPRRQQTAPVTTTANDVSTISSSPDPSAIAMRAYELYLAEGAMPGRDVEHWLKAESELRGIA
jgi:hypothetical protein